MRIINGIYRSRQIKYPLIKTVRPTKDRVREAVFSILNHNLTNCVVLDLFAGSGAYGLESISSGAKKVYFNDILDLSIKTIQDNINSLQIPSYFYKITNLDFSDCLRYYKNNNIIFDIVFIDPPYKEEIYEQIIQYMLTNNLLSSNSRIIIECDHILNFLKEINSFKVKQYKYKDTIIYAMWREV